MYVYHGFLCACSYKNEGFTVYGHVANMRDWFTVYQHVVKMRGSCQFLRKSALSNIENGPKAYTNAKGERESANTIFLSTMINKK